ncbi:cytosine permease [Streptomyces sp. CLV115]|uniref:cytosine permease n=1 Tax=Streptomyces sp. CLV115 TaxID=3138502 RepID=UPI00313DFBA3
MILRLDGPMSAALFAAFAVVGYAVLRHTDWSYKPQTPYGVALWAALSAGIALNASAPLSYNNSADFARYLPRSTSPLAVAGWTSAGVFIPTVLFTSLGALLISNFLDTVNNVLVLMICLLGPAMAVCATDIVLRRNRYDGPELCDQAPGSRFWYRGGFNAAGMLALIAGTFAALLCVDTVFWTGPVAKHLDGVDLSLPAGLVVSSVLYAVLMKRSVKRGATRW